MKGPDRVEEEIAIVGMACVFPGADSLDRYWQNLVDGVDCVTDPPESWLAGHACQQPGEGAEPVYTLRGGFLGDLCRFNPVLYGVMPLSVDGAEPDQFLALRCAAEALADAGVERRNLSREETGIIIGRGLFHNRGMASWVLHGMVVDQVVGLLRQLEPHKSDGELTALRDELKRRCPLQRGDGPRPAALPVGRSDRESARPEGTGLRLGRGLRFVADRRRSGGAGAAVGDLQCGAGGRRSSQHTDHDAAVVLPHSGPQPSRPRGALLGNRRRDASGRGLRHDASQAEIDGRAQRRPHLRAIARRGHFLRWHRRRPSRPADRRPAIGDPPPPTQQPRLPPRRWHWSRPTAPASPWATRPRSNR